MTFDLYADRFPIPDTKPFFLPSSTPPSVKSESSSSPLTDLSPSPIHSFSFSYPIPAKQALIAYNSAPHDFRFGMAHPPDTWSLKRTHHNPAHGAAVPLDINALAFPDDYDDPDELSDLPGSISSGAAAHATQSERIIRRRSSKGTSPPVLSLSHSR